MDILVSDGYSVVSAYRNRLRYLNFACNTANCRNLMMIHPLMILEVLIFVPHSKVIKGPLFQV